MFTGAERKISQHFEPSSSWTEESDSYCLIIDLPGFRKDELNLKVYNNERLVASGERQVNDQKCIRFEQSYEVPENSNIEDTTAKFEDEILFIVIPKNTKAQPEITNVEEIVKESEKEPAVDNAVLKEEEGAAIGNGSKNHHGNEEISDKEREEEEEGAAVGNGSKNHGGNEEISDKEREEEEEEEEEEDHHDTETTTTMEEEEEFHEAKMNNHINSLMKKLGEELKNKKNKGILIAAVLAFSLAVVISRKFHQNEK